MRAYRVSRVRVFAQRLLPVGILCLLCLAIFGPNVGARAPVARAAATAQGIGLPKPAPGPLPPIVAPRPSPSGGHLGTAGVPAAGPAPDALKQAVAAAIQAPVDKPLHPAAPATDLPAHGTVIGALPAPKISDTAGPMPPANPANKPLLIPAPSGDSPPTGQAPARFNRSTEVDDNTACGFGVNETSIAQSSVNPNLIVAGANTFENGDGSCGDSHVFAYYSHDGGQHWQQTILPDLIFQASGDPGVTYDPVHQVFLYSFVEFNRTDASGRIAVEVSSDGQHWGLTTSLDFNTPGHEVDKPMITVDQNPSSPHYGRVMVSWTDFTNSRSVFFEVYTDEGGTTWHPGGQTINTTNVSTCGNGTSPAFDANGEAMVAWWDCDTSPSQLREERSNDGGANWTFTPDVTIATVNDIEFAGSDSGCLMDNGGTAFRCNSFPSLAGDPDPTDAGGTAFVIVWANADSGMTDSRFPGQSATISEIHGISTVDGGTSWNAGAFSFNFMNFPNFGDKFFPWVAFSFRGRLNMGYSNRADDASAGNPNGARFDEWMTEAGSLTDWRNGSFITFPADGTLASPGSTTFLGDYAGATSLDSFDTFPIWTDVRSGANRARTIDLCYADCYTFLQPYTPLSISHGSGSNFSDLYQYNTDPDFGGSGSFFWNAVGIRSGADGTSVDDDTSLFGDRYFSRFLAEGGFKPPFNDYTLEDDNLAHGPSGPYFPQVHSFGTMGGSYSIEWAAGHTGLITSLRDSMSASNVVRVYDTLLDTGTPYFIGLRPAGGNTSNYRLALHSATRGNQQGSPDAVASSQNMAPGQPAFVSYNTGADSRQSDAVVVLNNNGGSGTYTLFKDTAAPSGSISINSGAASTKNANVTLTLAASNPTAGNPVSDMAFSTDGVTFGAWQAFASSAPFSLPSGDGSKRVFVKFRNGAGAVSAAASDSITLDTTAPHTTASLSGTATGCGPYLKAVTVTLNRSDNVSGVAGTVYQLDGGAVQTYSAPFTVSTLGGHAVTFHSTDRAGNVESTQTTSFTLVAPSLTQSPSAGGYHDSETISGTNYRAGEPIRVYWDSVGSTPISTTTATTSCRFVAKFSIPDATLGAHKIIALGATSAVSATATFTVRARLSLLHTTLTAGGKGVASGHGFGASEAVKLYWARKGGPLLGTSSTFSSGAFSGAKAITFTVPLSPTGTYNVVAVGLSSGAVATATATLPALTIAPSSGAHGSRATVSGSRFGPFETVTVKFNCTSSSCSGTTLGSKTTDANGNFTGLSVTIPSVGRGTYTVGGSGAKSTAFAKTSYTVTS